MTSGFSGEFPEKRSVFQEPMKDGIHYPPSKQRLSSSDICFGNHMLNHVLLDPSALELFYIRPLPRLGIQRRNPVVFLVPGGVAEGLQDAR